MVSGHPSDSPVCAVLVGIVSPDAASRTYSASSFSNTSNSTIRISVRPYLFIVSP